MDPKSFLEVLYTKNHELGLEQEVDEQKFKLTVKTPATKAASEEDELESYFDPKEVTLNLKFH